MGHSGSHAPGSVAAPEGANEANAGNPGDAHDCGPGCSNPGPEAGPEADCKGRVTMAVLFGGWAAQVCLKLGEWRELRKYS